MLTWLGVSQSGGLVNFVAVEWKAERLTGRKQERGAKCI